MKEEEEEEEEERNFLPSLLSSKDSSFTRNVAEITKLEWRPFLWAEEEECRICGTDLIGREYRGGNGCVFPVRDLCTVPDTGYHAPYC